MFLDCGAAVREHGSKRGAVPEIPGMRSWHHEAVPSLLAEQHVVEMPMRENGGESCQASRYEHRLSKSYDCFSNHHADSPDFCKWEP